MLVDPLLLHVFVRLSFLFCYLFPLVMEKYEKTCYNAKTCFNAEINDFDQQMACGAPICWSKYTTTYSNNKYVLSYYKMRKLLAFEFWWKELVTAKGTHDESNISMLRTKYFCQRNPALKQMRKILLFCFFDQSIK